MNMLTVTSLVLIQKSILCVHVHGEKCWGGIPNSLCMYFFYIYICYSCVNTFYRIRFVFVVLWKKCAWLEYFG